MNRYIANPADITQMLTQAQNLADAQDDASDQTKSESVITLDEPLTETNNGKTKSLSVGLIDCYRLTQECLTTALSGLHPEIKTTSFTTVEECIAAKPSDFDLIIYYLHGNDVPNASITQTIATICKAFSSTPVMIFSDADRAQQTAIMRSTLESGARGFVPTQTAGLPITSAAISLVYAGGTFVPADLMLASPQDRTPGRENRLTSRQGAVLGHLRQGKANKIIAYELGMSESTVKVHVRNIMRKMGATNRTQAAYKAQGRMMDFEGARMAGM
jgi:DNA-binding NarL/FixJ family response regulator